MLTDDKKITTPEYWAAVYEGNSHGKVDNSHTKRDPNAFDRFSWLADQVEGPWVLDIASGHAKTCKILKKRHPDWYIMASDQTEAAKKVADFAPYFMVDAYQVEEFANKWKASVKNFDTVTVSQAMEYFEDIPRFMKQIWRIARYFVCTVPIGEMKLWSQLHIFEEETFLQEMAEYGDIVHFDRVGDLLLLKLKILK